MLKNAQVGQKAVRIMGEKGEALWTFYAEVAAVDKETVTALVWVDIPRPMRFWIDTGVNVAGEHYGWLELIPA